MPGVLAELLRVLQHLVAVAVLAGVFALGLDVGAHRLERGQFVLADAAVQDFLLAGLGVEEPPAILLHDGNRERPGVVAHFEHAFGVRLMHEPLVLR